MHPCMQLQHTAHAQPKTNRCLPGCVSVDPPPLTHLHVPTHHRHHRRHRSPTVTTTSTFIRRRVTRPTLLFILPCQRPAERLAPWTVEHRTGLGHDARPSFVVVQEGRHVVPLHVLALQ